MENTFETPAAFDELNQNTPSMIGLDERQDADGFPETCPVYSPEEEEEMFQRYLEMQNESARVSVEGRIMVGNMAAIDAIVSLF
jgi:hypothetical protein